MGNRKILFISIFLFMIVLSIGVASAADADDAIASSDDGAVLEDPGSVSGTVSGGVDVVTDNPGKTSGELSYDIPANAKTIKSADVYVNVYSGSAANTYGADANITITAGNGKQVKSEHLWIEKGSTDGTVYTVNDHTTKCYSDYMIHYDIKNMLTGLNGTTLKINATTFKMENKLFDGRIKLIALVLAYDDGDDDSISYWINADQLWSKQNVDLSFNTQGKSGVSSLTNVVLSSTDGSYRLNNEFLGDPITHVDGAFLYKYNKWDISKLIDSNKNTTLTVFNNGASIKNVLSVIMIEDIKSSLSLATEYAGTAFAGTNNTLKVSVNVSKPGEYVVKLLADGKVVDEIKTNLDNALKTIFLTDQTIRPADSSTVVGADNKKVNYTVALLLDGATVNETTTSLSLLYNGNLGKEVAYPAGGMEALDTIYITGDIKIDNQDASTKLNATQMSRIDTWNVNLDANSNIVKSFVYIPYNWFNNKNYNETVEMFNITFNNVRITPISFYRDQSNLGSSYGKYGYGVLIYDVTDLLNVAGENKLILNKTNPTPSVYASVLVYMYNTTNSNYIKEVYINHGADLLSDHSTSLKNYANRTSKADSTIKVNPKLALNATLYVFASNALNNYGDLVFNGEYHKNIWNGASYCTEYKTFDVTGKIKDTNSISFIGTNGVILALQQIMVLTKNVEDAELSLATEYANTAYAGTTNAITITIDVAKAGTYTVKLLADGKVVNQTIRTLTYGTNEVVLIDPTIRPVNETTVMGAVNNRVTYAAELLENNVVKNTSSINVPILYDGYLGKDLAYPAGGMESFLNITITGDLVIDAKDASTKLGSGDMTRTDVWNINLDSKSSIVKSYIYVPYNWFNPNKGVPEDINMFNVTFNGVKVVPVAFYRDQGNLGTYGKYGYGLLVYDVTNLTKSGQNSFVLNKLDKTPSVYPSVLVYMYNTAGSAVLRNVYISNGADLLTDHSSSFSNLANRTVKADSTINVANLGDASKLYVFASNAKANYGNLVFNGQTYENIWSGADYSSEVFTLDITNSIKNSNSISFISTDGTILALQQIIVTTQKAKTAITAPSVTKVYNNNKNLVVTLKDANGNAVANAKVTVVLNGAKKVLTTNSNGQATLAISNLVPKTYTATITYDGDDTHLKSSATAKVTVKKASVKLTAKKKTFKAKVKTKKYTVTLKNNKNKVMKKVKLTLKVKGKTYKATTNAKGKATFKIKKLTKKGKYTAKVTFKGDKYYNKLTKSVKITVKK